VGLGVVGLMVSVWIAEKETILRLWERMQSSTRQKVS